MTPTITKDRAEQIIEVYRVRLSEDLQQKVAEWRASGNETRVSSNIRRRAFEWLDCALLEARALRDFERARRSLTEAMSMSLLILELEREGLQYESRDLEAGLYSAMILGSMRDAEKLAHAALRRPRVLGVAALYAGFSRLAASFVIDDPSVFEFERRWVNENHSREAAYWWRTIHDVYHDLMQSVLDRDLDRYVELMVEREQQFSRRPRDKKLQDVDLRFGGSSDDNSMVIDYMGTAIAKVALGRGMSFEYESELIPVELLRD